MSIKVSLPKKVTNVSPTGDGFQVDVWEGYEVTAQVKAPHGLLYINSTRWAILTPIIYVKAWCAAIRHAIVYR